LRNSPDALHINKENIRRHVPDKVKKISICFENCDSVDLGIEHDVRTYLRGTEESFFGELWRSENYEYRNFSRHRHAEKYASIEFDISALEVETRMSGEGYKTTLGTYLRFKDITHIDIVTDDDKSYYISLPWFPVKAWIDSYNIYQSEKTVGNKMEITFKRSNLWRNLPKGIWWYIYHNIGWWLQQQKVIRKYKKVH